MSATTLACGAAAALCLFAVADWPYGYYQILRFAASGASIAGGVWLLKRHRPQTALLAWLLVVLYNPIVPIRLGREVWTVVNLLSAVAFSFMAYATLGCQQAREERE